MSYTKLILSLCGYCVERFRMIHRKVLETFSLIPFAVECKVKLNRELGTGLGVVRKRSR